MTGRREGRSAREPHGCHWCGIAQRGHGRQWTEAAGWHPWTPPTDNQIKGRMRDRRGRPPAP
ncbi:hypothetical protein CG740_23270 [Streptomyces sp. CB01201]|nr:hypothetical protein CG740_23270 [Streptomyces sp. CB01201]